MKINLGQQSQYVHGAPEIEEREGYALLRRFPEAQAQKYRTVLNREDFYQKTFASAGMRVAVKTDADAMSFRYRGVPASSQKRCVFDLYIDGVLTESVGSLAVEETCEGICRFELPQGVHQVVLYLPNLYCAQLSEVELEGATVAEPIAKSRKLLCFGDSITQGYTTRYPSLTYVNRLADLLDAEVVNKGIGGDLFNPALLEVDDGYHPDLVTVAYGTNDWRHIANGKFEQNHTEFIRKLAEKYASSMIFVLTPIWRGNADASFYAHCDTIRATAERYETMKVIDGLSLIGHHSDFFMPDVLHPNDLGHTLYGESVAKEIKKHLHF